MQRRNVSCERISYHALSLIHCHCLSYNKLKHFVFSVRFVARSDVYHIVQQSISIIRAVQTQFLHQFLPRAYHFPIRNIISHRSFRIVSNYIHLQHESSVITLILLQLYFDKYVFINVFFNIFQICYYRFSMY